MGTRFQDRADGKLDKPPYRVRAGRPVIQAGKDNPENQATFDDAREALERGDVDAIGFVFTGEDPFTVIDLDDVIDPETGEIDVEAQEIVEDFPTYWEISTSGRGLHGVCIGSKPDDLCKKEPVELYDGRSGARFVILTGRRYGVEREVRDCSEQVNALYRRLFPEPKKTKAETSRPSSRPAPLEREELLVKARKARTGAKFRMLYDAGDISGFKSPSEADFSLINNLLFWTAGDVDLTVELFKDSALFRPPPEKDRGYVERSVKRAAAGYTGSYYRPKAMREETTPKQQDILTPYLALLLDASRWKGQKAAGAYKTYAALVISAVEDGISTDADELRIGADVRSLAERAGANRVTVCRSSLPYLVEKKLIRWQRGAGNRSGEFVLRRPEVPSGATIKETTQYFNGSTYGEGLDALARLIRMRSGSSKTGKVTHLGEMQKVARLGMVAMFCMVTLTTAPRGLTVGELVERTGRRKDHVLATMQKLVAAEICEESRTDFFTFAPAFWKAYQRSLISSGIVAAEHRQRKQHQKERRDNELKLKAGRDGLQRFDQNVIDLDAERRKKEDHKAARRQFTEGEGFLSREQVEETIQDAYERKVERCMDRLEGVLAAREERRRKKRAKAGSR
jgi:hypothetical protein